MGERQAPGVGMERSQRHRSPSGPLWPDGPPHSLSDYSVFFFFFFQCDKISQHLLAGLYCFLFLLFCFTVNCSCCSSRFCARNRLLEEAHRQELWDAELSLGPAPAQPILVGLLEAEPVHRRVLTLVPLSHTFLPKPAVGKENRIPVIALHQ